MTQTHRLTASIPRQRKACLLAVLLVSVLLLSPLLPWLPSALANPPVQGAARFSEDPDSSVTQAELDRLRHDLSKVDQYATEGIYSNASTIVGRSIKARDIYQGYIQKAADISKNLLGVRSKLLSHGETISLQQLGALAQRLSAENMHFRDSFRHGEEQFQTYQLIEKAILNLEDAIRYWRVSNKYRPLYRGSARERLEDDEILKLKLQTAVNAIEELQAIMDTRDALNRNLHEHN